MPISRALGRGSGIYGQMLALIIVPFVVLALFIVAFGWVEEETRLTQAAARISTAAAAANSALLATEIDAETGMRGYVATGDGAFLRPYRRARAVFPAQLALTRAQAVSPSHAAEKARLLDQAQRAFDIDSRLVALTQSGSRKAAVAGLGRGMRAMEVFRATSEEVQREITRTRARQIAKLSVIWRQSYLLLALEAVIGIGTTLALYFMITRRVVKRLRNVGKDAVAISRGDASGKPEVGDDEIALLDRTLRAMLADIKRRDVLLARYEILADHGQDIIVFSDEHDRIVEANVAAVAAYGYSREELLALPLRALFRGPESELEATLARVRAEGLLLREDEHVRKDGSSFPVELSYDAAQIDGEPLIFVVARDIAGRRATDKALADAYEGALESSRLKSQFVATMSHEIRTPMNAVIGMNELLLETTLSDEQRDYARTVRDSSLDLLHVIDDVLDFSKIEAGKLQIEALDFDLPDTLESATALFAAAAGSKNLTLMAYVDPKLRQMVRGDRGRIRQVLINLIGNALKFTSRGAVVVSATQLSQTSAGCTVRISVKDTGIGFDAATAVAIFEPFRQADGTTTRKYGGTGLGLSISKQLVELMAGTFAVTSEPGRGSEFTITLQLGRAKNDFADPVVPLDGARVLIVDDDRFALEILHSYVVGWEMQGDVADSAATGLAKMRAAASAGRRYDIVIVDYAMPDATGFDFCASVLADRLLTATPMVMVTSSDGSRRGEAAIAAGFSSYLTKPIRRKQLYDCLRAAIGKAAADASAQREANVPARSRLERVLVVEDNPVNQRLAVQQLKALGFAANVAGNGREALVTLAAEGYDLVFMDCHMPVVDGLSATRTIRTDELRTGRHVPIVAMTANARPEDRQECLAAGMDDYLAKPIQLAQLRAVLDRWVPAVGAPLET